LLKWVGKWAFRTKNTLPLFFSQHSSGQNMSRQTTCCLYQQRTFMFFFLEKIKRPPLKDIIKIKQVLGACELGLDGSRTWAISFKSLNTLGQQTNVSRLFFSMFYF